MQAQCLDPKRINVFRKYKILEEKDVEWMQKALIQYGWTYIQQSTSLMSVLSMFSEIAKLYKKYNIAMSYLHPEGSLVKMVYKKHFYKRIHRSMPALKEINSGAVKIIKSRMTVSDLNELDVNKQSSALMPNVTHSVDSSLCFGVINYLPKNESLMTIHDCFGTSTTLAALVRKALRKKAYEIFVECKMIQKIIKQSNLQETKQYNSNAVVDSIFTEQFKETPLLYWHFYFLINELKKQTFHIPTAQIDINNLQRALVFEMETLTKSSSHFTQFDFLRLNSANFVKHA